MLDLFRIAPVKKTFGQARQQISNAGRFGAAGVRHHRAAIEAGQDLALTVVWKLSYATKNGLLPIVREMSGPGTQFR